MEKFRWCFIGVGGLANRVVKQLLSSDRHEVVSCYRRNQKKNEEWAKKYHSKAYESAKDAILAPGVDAVYVVTPHSNHLEYAKLALSLGKPVLVEKSFTVSEKEAKELF
jgi:predicted dehydrogenase